MNKDRILVVEDDQRLRRLLARYLERGGFEVDCADSGKSMHKQLEDGSTSLILLDVMLPDKDGFTLAQEVRENSTIPIIFLTAKADIADKVSGLEIGADDYITKPFEEKELIARISTVLRRSQPETLHQPKKKHAVFAGWQLNMVEQTLLSPEGLEVEITSYEYQVLSALVNKPNGAISRDEILGMIAGREWSPLDRSADMAISKLRKKIEKDPKKPSLIRTVRNKGYQLTTEVELLD